MESLYRKSHTLFRTVLSSTLYDLPLLKIGVRNPPQNLIAIIPEWLKLYGLQIWQVYLQGTWEQFKAH